MDLTLQSPGDHLYIQSISKEGIRIANRICSGPLIVSASKLLTDWPVSSPRDLTSQHLDQILEFEPELVLIGTGKRQIFLPPEMLMVFYRQSVGIETMNTQAACRTFNVLVSEGRNVVAALMPITA
jgi:uncharacterized protein